MTHMFNISDSESEDCDDIVKDDHSNEKDSDIIQLEPAIERLRIHSDSQASTSSQGEDGELPEGATGEEGVEAGEGLRKRGRSMSAPPQLWAAKKYGRQLRRMSDEFDTILDSKAIKELQKERASKMRTSFSWFAFWRRKDSDNEINSNSGSGVDGRCAE